MSLTASEKATLHFYQWEYLGRGYHHFDEQVAIEPPFTPFVHNTFRNDEYIDDSRVPSIFKQISSFFSPPRVQKKLVEEFVIESNPAIITGQMAGFSISFPKGQEISSVITTEFLNMLTYSHDAISFEIHGTHEKISIQIVCSYDDKDRIESHLKAYFSTIIIQEIDIYALNFDPEKIVAIADFGLSNEFMLPIEISKSFAIDPLTSIIATFDRLKYGDTALVQMIFQGATAPWSKSIISAVSDGMGESFFVDAPEILDSAKEKVSNPLFSVVMRIATQGTTNYRSQYLAVELTQSISSISRSEQNKLIPLSNKDYLYENHLNNVYKRKSNRLGMILNSCELAQFVHFPNKTVVSDKLGLQNGKTKKLPQEAIEQKYVLGINEHNGTESKVTLSDQAKLRHTHIIGATGVGKSTLIGNMFIEDMSAGNGCVLFDPHGDIVEDILLRIPAHRKEDVIVIDPSDTEFPIGFNLLGAETDAEKIVLSSDLVSAFKRHATAWGDNMTSVLSNAINTFLESNRKGTLIELKRFLLEEKFRNDFLESVDDPSLQYYWRHEYLMVKKSIVPLLTRIDTFLRPKIVRYMLAQTKGIDFKECINQKKIILIKLSQGLIGEENSYLLGSLFLSKINQVAQARQSIDKTERHPYYIYLDEFHNFITPSITNILSGARKYGLGLVLAHQELAQIDDVKVLNSVISNPHTRICFRLGDSDAKRLESGFSYFEQDDLQSLSVGQTIIRIGSSKNDCNMVTFPFKKVEQNAQTVKGSIIENTRNTYAKPRVEIETFLEKTLPKTFIKSQPKKNHINTEENIIKKSSIKNKLEISPVEITESNSSLERQKEAFIQQEKKKEHKRKHSNLQDFVKKVAQERGYKVTIEKQTDNGGRVDVSLLKDDVKIAIEISVTNTLDYEVQNIQKCIDDGYHYIFMISESMVHLKNIKTRAKETIDSISLKKVTYFTPLSLVQNLDALTKDTPKASTKRVRGYRVTTNYNNDSSQNDTQNSISKLLINAVQKKK